MTRPAAPRRRRPSSAPLAALLLLLIAPPAAAHEPGEEEGHAPLRTAPSLVERVEPLYPEGARSAGIGGTVRLDITVAADGSVGEVKVLAGVGFGLDEAAVAAAKRFKFKPATDGGKAVASRVLFEQGFVVTPRFSAEIQALPAAEPAPAPAPSPGEGKRYETTVRDRGPVSAASASTIRNQDFDLRPRSSPNDLLRVVPGLLAVQHQGGGKGDQLFLRGFDADHGTDVNLLVDGIPVNLPAHAHGQGFVDLHWIIPEAIERIDVVKGPYDVRYGDFATAGAVNLITRDRFPDSSAAVMLGGFPTLGCQSFPVTCKVVAQQRFVGVVAPRLGGFADKLTPWLAFEAARDDGPIAAGQGLQRYNLLAKLAYRFTPTTTLGALFSAYGSAWNSSGQIPSREVEAKRLDQFGAVDPTEGGLTQRYMASLFFQHKNGRDELSASLYYTRYKLSLWNNFTLFAGDPTLGDLIEQSDDRHTGGLHLSYHVHHHLRGLSFRTTLGAQVRYDATAVEIWDATSQDGAFRKRLRRHLDTGGFPFGNQAGISILSLAAFAEEDVIFTRWLRALVGLRGDYFGFSVDDKGEALGAAQPATSGVKQKAVASPKATLVFSPLRALDLYLNFGMGFHTNDARLAVQEGRTTPHGSVVNTVPRIYGGELGARFSFRDRLSIAAALWASYLENESVFVGDAGAFEPSDPSRRLGVDGEVRVKALSWLHFDADVAWAQATTLPKQGPSGQVALAPTLYLTAGATVSHPVGLRAGLRVRALADRPAFTTTDAAYVELSPKQPSRVNAKGWAVVDLYGAYRYRFIEVSLSLQNLFNSTWREAQVGNLSCVRGEVDDPSHPSCSAALPKDQRAGVADVHFTPGVPFNLQLGLKAYF